jgi:hypothetical protein
MTRRQAAAMTLLALSLHGCGPVSLAALGTALGVGAAAVSTGASVYSLGKLNSAEPASADQVRHAMEAAAADLDLRSQPGGGFDESGITYTGYWADAFGAPVEVTIQQRSSRLTRLRIDVGVFGNEPTAKLILARVRDHLPAATTRPLDVE